MSIEDLRGFVSLLEESGELCRVAVQVDPVLEIAAITDRVCKAPGGGKALFFEQVKGHSFPVLTNLFGSYRRVAWALWNDNLQTLAARLEREIAQAGPGGAEERLRRLVEAPGFLPKLVTQPPCQEVACRQQADLGMIPALQSWPDDGGRFLTLPLVFTRNPATGRSNCGMYRVQIFDGQSAALHWRKGSDAGRHHAAWQARGKRMPVAIALGGDPALIYAAGAPLPPGVDEAAFAGYLRQRRVSMAKCLTCDLHVPAAAEFVIEGYVEPQEERLEGPFGNHTGYYAEAAPCPVFHVTAITHRRDPLYPCTLVGPPPMEDCYLAKATERLFLPLLRHDHPGLVDMNLPMEGIFHGCALLGGRRLIRGLWTKGVLKNSRLLVACDEQVDVQNCSEAFWRAINSVDPQRDVLIEGGRLGIDATGKAGRPQVVEDDLVTRLVQQRWGEYGIKL